MNLPKYRIYDQVIFEGPDPGYFLGIIKTGQKTGEEWSYTIPYKTTTITILESKIKGAVYLNSEKLDFTSRKEAEDTITLN